MTWDRKVGSGSHIGGKAMNRYKPVGWRGESYRHYLASKGVKTKRYFASLQDAQVVSLYHGTRSNLAKKIMREGLKPSQDKNEKFIIDSGGFVHLTPAIDVAVKHALRGPERSIQSPGENPVVLKVTIPKKYLHVGGGDVDVDVSADEKLKYAKSTIPGFDALDDEQKQGILDSITVTTVDEDGNLSKAGSILQKKSAFMRGYVPELEKSPEFQRQYELVTKENIPARHIKEIAFEKAAAKGIRKRQLQIQQEVEDDE